MGDHPGFLATNPYKHIQKRVSTNRSPPSKTTYKQKQLMAIVAGLKLN